MLSMGFKPRLPGQQFGQNFDFEKTENMQYSPLRQSLPMGRY